MNDNGRDELDRALGDGLSALAPDVADPDVVLGGMRPQLRRARTRHRVTQVSSVVAVLLVFVGAAALASNRSTSGHVDVAAPSTSASPTTGRPHNSTTTVTTTPHTQTISPDRGSSATTVPVVVPPATTNGSHGSRGPGDGRTTTSVAQSGQHTYSSPGGSVTVNLHAGALALVSYQAAPGYTAEVHSTQADDVEVRFSKDGTEWRIRVRLDHGQLVPEISQH
jgi:hypothetical protein